LTKGVSKRMNLTSSEIVLPVVRESSVQLITSRPFSSLQSPSEERQTIRDEKVGGSIEKRVAY